MTEGSIFLNKEIHEIEYEDIKEFAEKKKSDYIKTKCGCHKPLRCYSLSNNKLDKKIKEWHSTGLFPSPYSGGIFSYQIKALVNLGINKAWLLELEILPEIERIMSKVFLNKHNTNAWKQFVEKPPKGERNQDYLGRIYFNYRNLRRVNGLNPIGYKMKQMGACIDLFFDLDHRIYIRLNTYSINPIKMDVLDRNSIPPVDMSIGTLGPH